MLDRLAQLYRLLIVGAGSGSRIFRQMGGYPIDILANYGMQEWEYCQERGEMEVVRNISVRCDRESVDRRMDQLRRQFGYMNYAGESVEYHLLDVSPSHCLELKRTAGKSCPLTRTGAAAEPSTLCEGTVLGLYSVCGWILLL